MLHKHSSCVCLLLSFLFPQALLGSQEMASGLSSKCEQQAMELEQLKSQQISVSEREYQELKEERDTMRTEWSRIADMYAEQKHKHEVEINALQCQLLQVSCK